MIHILAPILALFLFPSVAFGETMDDLVITNGLYYKKFTDIPFTGKITGKEQGSIKNGERIGVWIEYNKNGRVSREVTYKIGKIASWLTYSYHDNGQVNQKRSFKNGKQDGVSARYYKDGQLAAKGT